MADLALAAVNAAGSLTTGWKVELGLGDPDSFVGGKWNEDVWSSGDPVQFFSFDGSAGSYIDTPNTPDLGFVDTVDIVADIRPVDWAAAAPGTIVHNGGTGVRQALRLAAGTLALRTNVNTYSAGTGLSVSSRHIVRGYMDATDRRLWLDGTQIGSIGSTAQSGPVVEPLRIGSDASVGGNLFVGDIFSAQIGKFDAEPLAVFDAADATFPTGPVADGSTFTSNGRVWTVHGAGVSFTDDTLEGGRWASDDAEGFFVDATGITRQITTDTGRHTFTSRFKAGKCTLILNNDSGVLTPAAGVAPPLGLLPLAPYRKVRITYNGGSVWYGYVDTMSDSYRLDGMIITKVVCLDELGWLARDKQGAAPEQGAGDTLQARLIRIRDRFVPDLMVQQALPGAPFTTLQSTTMAQDAATQMHLAADSEGGGVWMSRDGIAVLFVNNTGFRDKMDGPADWVVGGTNPIQVVTTGSEFSAQFIINEAHYSRRGGTEQIASVPAVKRRTHTRLDLENETDDDVLLLASEVVTVASVNRQRLTSLTIMPTPGDAAQQMAVSGKIGDKVQVTVTTLFGWSYSVVSQIFGVSHQVVEDRWFVVYRLDDTLFDGEFSAFSDAFSDGFN